jgi:hypothetical protein
VRLRGKSTKGESGVRAGEKILWSVQMAGVHNLAMTFLAKAVALEQAAEGTIRAQSQSRQSEVTRNYATMVLVAVGDAG